MTTVPLTQCCRMLDIDAKTLRQWLKHSNLSLHCHPTDARIKCLSIEHVHQLATLHGRCIKLDATASLLLGLHEPTHLPSESLPTSILTPGTLGSDPDLIGKLSCLEATMATMQQQLTQLALELLQRERRLQALEALIQQSRPLACPQEIQTIEADATKPDAPVSQGRRLHPAEQRARSRVLPLIEYGADGSYVIICPQEGELYFSPDSAEWFDWLASLSSFRFVGTCGRFCAYRKGSNSCGWSARRFFHQRHYYCYLGTTSRLTIDRLEEVAATLSSRIASL